MVRSRVPVAVVNEEGIVVDTVLRRAAVRCQRGLWTALGQGSGASGVTHEKVYHLVDGEGARAVVVEQRVERLQLR